MGCHPSALPSGVSCDTLPSQKELAQLARDDPHAFEALRKELIENAILRAPERFQLRLRQLQFRVDGIRRLARTPLGALIKMQSMMWDSFLRMDEALQQFDALSRVVARRHASREDRESRMSDPAHNAQIIDFRTRLPLGG